MAWGKGGQEGEAGKRGSPGRESVEREGENRTRPLGMTGQDWSELSPAGSPASAVPSKRASSCASPKPTLARSRVAVMRCVLDHQADDTGAAGTSTYARGACSTRI